MGPSKAYSLNAVETFSAYGGSAMHVLTYRGRFVSMRMSAHVGLSAKNLITAGPVTLKGCGTDIEDESFIRFSTKKTNVRLSPVCTFSWVASALGLHEVTSECVVAVAISQGIPAKPFRTAFAHVWLVVLCVRAACAHPLWTGGGWRRAETKRQP